MDSQLRRVTLLLILCCAQGCRTPVTQRPSDYDEPAFAATQERAAETPSNICDANGDSTAEIDSDVRPAADRRLVDPDARATPGSIEDVVDAVRGNAAETALVVSFDHENAFSRIQDVSTAQHELSNESARPSLPTPVSNEATENEADDTADRGDDDSPSSVPPVPDPAAPTEVARTFPIDLPTALRLAGAENWSVRLAYERICEAQARLEAAEAMWLPSLNLGVGFNKHDGQLQATNGRIVDVSRNSLFVGGGAVTGNAPSTGASGGPARFFIDLSLADAIFEPLARRQLVCAERSGHAVMFNNTLLEATLAYYALVGAQAQAAIAQQNIADAEEVLTLTEAFVAAGKASDAEVTRVKVQASRRQQQLVQARLAVKLASAELARILQLDPRKLAPGAILYTVEQQPVPVEFVPETSDLQQLVMHAKSVRPEVAETFARAESDRTRFCQEQWRPLIPNVHVGVSAGVFGGGIGSHNGGLDGRSDVDALLIWKVDNMGYGVRAARQERASLYRQSVLRSHQAQDVIATEVAQAWHQMQAQRQTMQLAEQTVDQAVDVYRKNMRRIRGLEGLPLEALQSLQAVAQSRSDYLNALLAYNQAQAMLLRSIGQPIRGT